MGEKWSDGFQKRVKGVLENLITERSSDDDIRLAIESCYDLDDLLKEVVGEDDIEEKLKTKLRELVLGKIISAESIEDLIQDSESIGDALSDNIDIDEIIKELITEDKGLKEALRSKTKELAITRIGDMNSDDLPEWDDFCSTFDLDNMINEMLENDQEVKGAFAKELKNVMISYIESNLDENDLPDDLMSKLNVEETVNKIIESGALKVALEKAIRSILQTQLETQLSSGKLSENLWNTLPMEEIKRVVEDQSFRDDFSRQLAIALRDILPELISSDNEMFVSLVFANPVIANFMANAAREVLRDPKASAKLKKVVGKMVKNEKMLKKYFPESILDQLKAMFRLK